MTQTPPPSQMLPQDTHLPADARIRPAGWWYVVGVLLIFAGLVVPIAGITHWGISLAAEIEALSEDWIVEIDVPGQADFELEGTGDYEVFYEFDIDVAGRHYSTDPQLPGLIGKLRYRETGEEVLLNPGVDRPRRGRRPGRYDDSRVIIWEFHVDRGGALTLDVAYPNGAAGPERIVLAVERQMTEEALSRMSGMCVLFPLLGLAALGGVGGGVAMLIVVGVKRSRRRREMAMPGPPPESGGTM